MVGFSRVACYVAACVLVLVSYNREFDSEFLTLANIISSLMFVFVLSYAASTSPLETMNSPTVKAVFLTGCVFLIPTTDVLSDTLTLTIGVIVGLTVTVALIHSSKRDILQKTHSA